MGAWCGPCQTPPPHLGILAGQFAGKAKVLKLNVDEDKDTFERFGIRGIPSLIFYANGREHDRLTGTSSLRLRETVKKWLRESGVSLPGDDAVQSEAVDRPPEPQKWCAFGGDASRKAAAVARLRQQQIEQRGERRPAEVLAGGQTFEAAMGMPQAMGNLLDFVVVFRNPGERGARAVDMAKVLSTSWRRFPSAATSGRSWPARCMT